MVGWFYTNRDGVICRCALHEISPATIFQKLVGSATLDEEFNPYAYVALCHFESGISRPLKQQELQHLVSPQARPCLSMDVQNPTSDTNRARGTTKQGGLAPQID